MKRKILIVLLSVVCSFCLAFELTACGGSSDGANDSGANSGDQSGDSGSGSTDDGNSGSGSTGGNTEGGGETTHTHTAGEAVTENVVEATCIAAGSYDSVVYCSECSEELSRETTTIPATGEHTYDGSWTCSVCGYSIAASEGLSYTLSPGETYYTLSGIGTCTATDIVIPYTYEGLPVTSIGRYAFFGCDSLKSITIPDSVTSIGEGAFDDCAALASINIPDSVTYIGRSAFNVCYSLKSITIPDSVTYIGESAFFGCKSLLNITVDDGNTNYKSIDGNLYSYDGTVLIQYAVLKTDTSFAIPDGVTSIGSGAFYNCTSLESITIPNSVTSIGSGAFYNCTSLESITIPDSVTYINNSAFYGCTSLANISIGSGVTYIGVYVFNNTAYCNDENNWEDGALYMGSCLIAADTSISGSYTIKEGTTVIANYAFRNCTALTSVTIPDSVITIGGGAFYDCTSLTSITIPNSVITIGDYAFMMCSSLESVLFEGSDDWCVFYEIDGMYFQGYISGSELADASTAATYLTSTYCDYTLSKSAE